MPRSLFLLPLLAAPLLCSHAHVLAAPAQPAAPSALKLAYLDDDAEAGGFDITGKLLSLPVAWSLCENAQGQAYLLKLSSGGATLSLKSRSGDKDKDKDKELAAVRAPLAAGALVVQRRGAMWRVLLNNKTVLEAEDATLSAGKVGYAGAVSEAKLQPVEEIALDDDFMRVKEDVAYQAAKGDPHSGMRISDIKDNETIWKSVAGTWATTGLSENAEAQVAQSVNAFVFKTASAGDSMALAGRPFWNDYSFEASVRPEGASAIGLAFYAQDARNYLIMKWQARQGLDENSGRVLLQAVVDGKETTLAQSAGGFEDKQWYRMKVAISGNLVRAYVDDNEVARARTTLFGRGQAGLWAHNDSDKASALFDDVRVRSNHDIEDDFSRRVPGRWQAQGEWNWNGAAQATGAAASRALIGEAGWHDYSVAAPLALPADGSAGLLLNESAEGAYLVRVGGSRSHAGFAGKAQILKLGGGKVQVLASAPIGSALDGKAVTLGASADDGYLSATVDGTRVADAFDDSLKSGRAGLWSRRASTAPTFGAFAVRFPDVRPTWAKVPELYNDARQAETMGGWSTPEGFWLPTNPMADPNAALATQVSAKPADASKLPTTMWHKGTFWGDGGMKFKVPELSAAQSFVILLDGPSSKAGNEMQLAFMVKDGALQCSLTQGSQATPVANGSVKIEGKASDYNVDIRQRGSFIIVRAAKGDAARSTLFAARVK